MDFLAEGDAFKPHMRAFTEALFTSYLSEELDDMVLIKAVASSNKVDVTAEAVCYADLDDELSAMQFCTAAPVAGMVDLLTDPKCGIWGVANLESLDAAEVEDYLELSYSYGFPEIKYGITRRDTMLEMSSDEQA
jgi:saccharopine dehydrogenase-like NADP-dependent oxidoreductase